MSKSDKKVEPKAFVLQCDAYEQEPPLAERQYDTMYNCKKCGKIYRVYRGDIECSCTHHKNGY